jgi:hypothetical protein
MHRKIHLKLTFLMMMMMMMIMKRVWGDLEKMNMLIFVAIILNPVYKFVMLEASLVEIYGSKKRRRTSEEARPTQVKKGGVSGTRFMKNLEEKVSARDESDGGVFKTEFDRYLHELRIPSDQIEILAWWKLNAPRFPILAHMARDVLAIPVTTVPSESAFSTGGHTLDQFRSCLTPTV